jgi:hypothetical protein
MARINSKSKGNTAEREVANKLTEALSPLIFQRNSLSGSFLGGKNAHRIQEFSNDKAEVQLGDVYCSSHSIRFNIEVKSYKTSIPFHHLLEQKCLIKQWFEECKIDAEKLDKVPLLIFKFNRVKFHFCIYSQELWNYNTTVRYRAVETIDIDNISIGLLDDLLEIKNDWWL